MPNIVSACHGAPIVTGLHVEHPLDGRTWGQAYSVDVCGACGKETEPVHTCEWCGAELNGDNPEITGGGGCHQCMEEVVVDADESR